MTASNELNLDFTLSHKQGIAWSLLWNDHTTELLFGGAAGGGKSRLGCYWILTAAIKFPGTRWLLGRSVLKNLKASTLQTLFDIFREQGIQKSLHYTYNQQENVITLFNGSQIYLMDLEFKPSDPNYDRIGSTEFTSGFVDEANQITAKCRDVITSRLRYKIDEFGIVAKLLMTCNPAKNFVYSDYYKPNQEGTLPHHAAFLQALVTDNPFISPKYIETLKRMKDKAMRERLLHGNWEYDDDPTALFPYDVITDLFSNHVDDSSELYLTVDVARLGEDRTTAGVWRGLKLIDIRVMERSRVNEVDALMEHLAGKYKIPLSRQIADEDGIGGGVVDYRGCRGFVGGSRPITDPAEKFLPEEDRTPVAYLNLRAQCYYLLADYAGERKLRIQTENSDYRQYITEELEQIKRKDQDKDGKLKVIAKDQIKEHLGRSPDFADMLMERMWFELPKGGEVGIRLL